MTKICCLSDTHLRNPVLPESDIVFHCGDYLMGGTYYEWEQNFKWLKRERKKSKKWITTFGNHDIWCERNPEEVRESLAELDIDLLVDEFIEVAGLKIYGTPWVPFISGRWAWEEDRGEKIRKHWDKIPQGLDVLLTHGPPYMIMDQSVRPSGNISQHFGCEELRDTLLKMEEPPKLHIFGHVHMTPDQRRIEDSYGITKFINAALLDDFYELVNEPIVLEI